MAEHVWLNTSDQLVPGAELYRSDRRFQLWDYTPSHSQLLLRSTGRKERTQIDILFKPVHVLKICASYDGLRLRCATDAEQRRIKQETPGVNYAAIGGQHDQGSRFFILEANGSFDYVIAQAVGWHEAAAFGEASFFAYKPDTDAPPWARTALDGVSGGLGTPTATAGQLVEAIVSGETHQPGQRSRYRDIYVVLCWFDPPDPAVEPVVAGAFITRAEAEQHQQRLASRSRAIAVRISAVPVPI